MKFYVELPESTGITPDELTELWNRDNAAANLGEASVESRRVINSKFDRSS